VSDELKKKSNYITRRISELVNDTSTSKLIQDTLIDLLEDQEQMNKLLFDLENQFKDIQENLKDTDSHKMK